MSKAKIKLIPQLGYTGYHYLKWAMIHTAIILFFADLIAAVWPAFEAVWIGHAKIAIAIASLTAAGAEYFNAKIEDAKDETRNKEATPSDG